MFGIDDPPGGEKLQSGLELLVGILWGLIFLVLLWTVMDRLDSIPRNSDVAPLSDVSPGAQTPSPCPPAPPRPTNLDSP